MNFTVYFDGQFWAALIELHIDGNYYALSHTFGVEPKDGELYLFVNSVLPKLIGRVKSEISLAIAAGEKKKLNPKRMKKLARQAAERNPVSTKSQEALQRQMELNKKESRNRSRQAKLDLLEFKHMKAVEKAKQKHRGH
jgi:hypothetical protein